MVQNISLKYIAVFITFIAIFALVGLGVIAYANHGSPVDVEEAVTACGETTVSASMASAGPGNMYLVLDTEDGEEQFVNIPANGDSVDLTVGPFFTSSVETQTVSWHVFGGGERDYDDPHWIGYGGETFGADIGAYADEVGTFNWVIQGTDDPNPFVTWNEIEVESCAITKDDCKDGGWEAYGFDNQGQCIQFVNTEKDSR